MSRTDDAVLHYFPRDRIHPECCESTPLQRCCLSILGLKLLTYKMKLKSIYCRFDLNFVPSDPVGTHKVGKMRERQRRCDHTVAYQLEVEMKIEKENCMIKMHKNNEEFKKIT